jgi:hypothetical protein
MMTPSLYQRLYRPDLARVHEDLGYTLHWLTYMALPNSEAIVFNTLEFYGICL